MKIAISAPSGYNTRELLLPLSLELDKHPNITEILVITPAAQYRSDLFSELDEKYILKENPTDQMSHNKMLHDFSPDVVVTPTNGLDPKDPAIIRAARKNNIPSCTFVASWDNVYKIERALGTGRDIETPNKFAVWNEMKLEHLHEIYPELTDSAVEIVGSPRFDYFSHHQFIPTRDDLIEYLSLPKDGAKLVHCATTELYPLDYIVKQLDEARQQRSVGHSMHIYASVHPGGDIGRHEVLKKYGAIVRYSFGRREKILHKDFQYMPTREEIYMAVALFRHSDLLVNQSSTVAIESALADTPMINVKYGKRFDWWGWYRSSVYRDFKEHYADILAAGGSTIVKNSRALINAVNQYFEYPMLKHEQRMATAQKMITFVDGRAAKRLLDLLVELAQ